MGLDMYLTGRKDFWRTYGRGEERQEDGFIVEHIDVRLGYWRKHPNLHGYIVATFAAGIDECQPIDLTVEQLEQTLEAVKADDLPNTQGFFFGKSQPEDRPETIAILEKAIAWLKAGDASPIQVSEPIHFGFGLAMEVKPIEERPTEQQVLRRVTYQASW